ncbi:MAG TPA: type I phosphomannose isomerase catalytic subunit [Clostridia bacterium]|nr:type I phosphomannose isomerase catalytic subunit [Clostridia bacterium]
MQELYPLLLIPHFDERVWGTRDLAPVYSRVVGKEPIGEVWLTGDQCRVANGPLSGQTLSDLCRTYRTELVGDVAPQPDRFPLLIKFLFPKQKLSVQVHPDDQTAQRIGQPWGKTECWYVMRSVAGAKVALGLKPGTTREAFREAIEQKRAEELLNWVDVKVGDMIYVDAGTVHAIAPGSILIETQQSSDITYRLYDYGRPRELHISEGLAAMQETTGAGKVHAQEIDGHKMLVASPCFIVEQFSVAEQTTFTAEPGKSSAQVLVGLDGCGVVECESAQPVSFNRGEAVLIPASVRQFALRPQWNLEMLRMRVPVEEIAPPVTHMP